MKTETETHGGRTFKILHPDCTIQSTDYYTVGDNPIGIGWIPVSFSMVNKKVIDIKDNLRFGRLIKGPKFKVGDYVKINFRKYTHKGVIVSVFHFAGDWNYVVDHDCMYHADIYDNETSNLYVWSETWLSLPSQDTEVKLNKQFTATINKEGIKIGCQSFTFEQLDQLVNVSKEYRK